MLLREPCGTKDQIQGSQMQSICSTPLSYLPALMFFNTYTNFICVYIYINIYDAFFLIRRGGQDYATPAVLRAYFWLRDKFWCDFRFYAVPGFQTWDSSEQGKCPTH